MRHVHVVDAAREIKILTVLTKGEHAHVVPVFQINFVHETRKLITVSLLCPWNLRTHLESSSYRMPLEQVRLLTRHMVSGISYCHQQHVLHRDLKPANMLLGIGHSSRLELRLADFGSSVFLANDGGDMSLLTTWGCSAPPFQARRGHLTPGRCTYIYAAPEVLMMSQRYGFAADMWSIGTILGEMLCGKILFACDSQTPEDVVKQILDMLGPPADVYWPGFEHDGLPAKVIELCPRDAVAILGLETPQGGTGLTTNAFHNDQHGLAFASSLLMWCPSKRLSAAVAINHQFLVDSPCFASPLVVIDQGLAPTASIGPGIEDGQPSSLEKTSHRKRLRQKTLDPAYVAQQPHVAPKPGPGPREPMDSAGPVAAMAHQDSEGPVATMPHQVSKRPRTRQPRGGSKDPRHSEAPTVAMPPQVTRRSHMHQASSIRQTGTGRLAHAQQARCHAMGDASPAASTARLCTCTGNCARNCPGRKDRHGQCPNEVTSQGHLMCSSCQCIVVGCQRSRRRYDDRCMPHRLLATKDGGADKQRQQWRPTSTGAALAQERPSEAAPCSCDGNCRGSCPGRADREGACSGMATPDSRYCLQCLCSHPRCKRQRRRSHYCKPHRLPDTLCLTRDWSPLLAEMLPCDLATFLQVWGHVQHDIALEAIVIMIKDPTAVREFIRLAQSLPKDYDANTLMEVYHQVLHFMDGRITKAEHENLTRQGVSRSCGLAVTMQCLCLLQKVPAGSAALSHENTVRLGSTLICYKLASDTTCLETFLSVCRETRLPIVKQQDDLKAHMEAYTALLARCPGSMRLGGKYIGPTLCRKHLLGLLQVMPPIHWDSVTRSQLQDWSVDRNCHLASAPADWTVAELQAELRVPALHISMWACLFSEVTRLGRDAIRFGHTELVTLRATLNAYLVNTAGIPPCPYVLLMEARR